MAPTISSIAPSSGHSGGRQLVEILGSGFQQLADPPATGPVDVPPAAVRVWFGTTEAVEVLIVDSTRLLVTTPILDPAELAQAVTADAGADTLAATAHTLVAGQRVRFETDGTLPAPLVEGTPYYVLGPSADAFQVEATVGGGAVDLTDTGSGTHQVVSDQAVDVTVENLQGTPAELVTESAGPFALSDGQTLLVVVDGGAEQVITFLSADFGDIGNATAAEVAAAINAGVRSAWCEVNDDDEVRLVTDSASSSSRLEVTGGTATALDFPSGEVSGSDERTAIPAERATLQRAWTPVRPDLGAESHLSTVVGQFVLELRRQILANTTWTTHTDYDAETGDQLNLAMLAKLPALVLAGVSIPEDRIHAVQSFEEYNVNDPEGDDGDVVITRPPVVVDVVGALIGVSDNPAELLNLAQAVRLFFQKNITLTVPRLYGDASAGTIDYDLHFDLDSSLAITAQGDNSNVQWFAGDFMIEGVRLEDMPGMPAGTISTVPADVPAEAVVGLTKTADTIDVAVYPKD